MGSSGVGVSALVLNEIIFLFEALQGLSKCIVSSC